MFDFSSIFQNMGNNLGNAFSRAGNNIAHPFQNISQGNMLSSLVHPQSNPDDPWAGMRQVEQPTHQPSDLSKQFQTLGSMGQAPAAQFSPAQFQGPGQGGTLSDTVAQLLKARGIV